MRTRVSSVVRTPWTLTLALLIFAGISPDDANAQSSGGVIKGTVRDSIGAVVVFAEVAVVGSELRTLTDATGRFRLADVPFGDVDLRVRRLGYRPSISTVALRKGAEPDVELQLVAIPDYLPAVEVREERQVYDARLAGFKARSAKGVGHFITRDRLERLHSYRFTDVLREIPGVRMRTLRGGGSTITLRGAWDATIARTAARRSSMRMESSTASWSCSSFMRA